MEQVQQDKVASRQNPLKLIKVMRPRQWTKNLIAFAPLLFSMHFHELDLLMKVTICCICLCLVSGAVYVLNDVLDVEADRAHPTKKNRPIASGAVSVNSAIAVGVCSAILGIAIGFCVRPMLGVVLILYLALQFLYTLWAKHKALLDAFSIAAGFVLRALAGGVAANVPLSCWFLLCTSFGALFLALEKRRQELKILGDGATAHRKVLGFYSVELLDRLEAIILPSLITAYSFYSFQSQNGQWMMLTVPFVLYGVMRFKVLSHRDTSTSAPEEVLLKDRPIQITIILWVLTCAGVIYQWIPNSYQYIERLVESLNFTPMR